MIPCSKAWGVTPDVQTVKLSVPQPMSKVDIISGQQSENSSSKSAAADSGESDTEKSATVKKSQQRPKIKRRRNPFKNFEVKLETEQRSDVVLKTILRQIRRHYLLPFNESTKYISVKRSKDPEFYRQCLKNFISEL